MLCKRTFNLGSRQREDVKKENPIQKLYYKSSDIPALLGLGVWIENKFLWYKIYCCFEQSFYSFSSAEPSCRYERDTLGVSPSDAPRTAFAPGIRSVNSIAIEILMFFQLISLRYIQYVTILRRQTRLKGLLASSEIYFLCKFNASCHYNETIHWKHSLLEGNNTLEIRGHRRGTSHPAEASFVLGRRFYSPQNR